jgi:hypothetical protein
MTAPVVITLRCGEGVQLGDMRMMVCSMDAEGLEVMRSSARSSAVFSLSGYVQLGVSADGGRRAGRAGVTVREVSGGRARLVIEAPEWCEVRRIKRGEGDDGG